MIKVRQADNFGVEIPMPTWTDPTSIVTFATAIIAAVNGVLLLTHTGYQVPSIVEASVVPVSFVIAAGVLIANVVRHWKATAAAIAR